MFKSEHLVENTKQRRIARQTFCPTRFLEKQELTGAAVSGEGVVRARDDRSYRSATCRLAQKSEVILFIVTCIHDGFEVCRLKFLIQVLLTLLVPPRRIQKVCWQSDRSFDSQEIVDPCILGTDRY